MAKRGGYYFSHVRGEAATLEKAYVEAIRIGEEGGVPVQIAHVKASGRENWGKMERALRMISDARARGVDVTGDVYPYPAGSTKMDNLLPPWMHDGGTAKLLERLADPAARERAIADCLIDGERWRTGSGSYGWDEVMVATCSRPELAGKNLAELARLTGREPAHAMMDLVLSEKAGVSMVGFSQSEENVAIASADPHTMIGSDSLSLHSGPGPHPGKPHPRSYGTFPRVLGVYCREKRLFSWETAVHKMTGMPAGKLGSKDRGLVKTRLRRRPRALRSRRPSATRRRSRIRTGIRRAFPTSSSTARSSWTARATTPSPPGASSPARRSVGRLSRAPSPMTLAPGRRALGVRR